MTTETTLCTLAYEEDSHQWSVTFSPTLGFRIQQPPLEKNARGQWSCSLEAYCSRIWQQIPARELPHCLSPVFVQAWSQYVSTLPQSTTTPVKPPLLSDTFWNHLYPFQKTSVALLYQQRRMILGDDMGLGKTVQIIAALRSRLVTEVFPVLIVAPTTLSANWRRALMQWWPEVAFQLVQKMKPPAVVQPDTVYFASYGMLSSEKAWQRRLEPVAWKSVICDESHYLKRADSQRTQRAMSLCYKETVEQVYLLTGTLLDRHEDVFAPLYLIRRSLFPLFYDTWYRKKGWIMKYNPQKFYFGQRYCVPTIRFLGRRNAGLQFKSSVRTEELNVLLKHGVLVIRRRKQDYLTELPDKQRCYTYLGPLDRKHILQPFQEKAPETTDRLFMELFRKTSDLKRPFVVEHVKEVWLPRLEQDSRLKMILFTYHEAMMDALRLVFPTAPWIDGRVPATQRGALVQTFRTEPAQQVILLSIQTSAAGLDLPEANHVVFVELGFSPGQVLQGEDRAHRLGQKRDVTVTYVLLENSMDDVVLQMIDKKLRVAHGCLDAAAVAASAVESEQLHPSRKRKRAYPPDQALSFIDDDDEETK